MCEGISLEIAVFEGFSACAPVNRIEPSRTHKTALYLFDKEHIKIIRANIKKI